MKEVVLSVKAPRSWISGLLTAHPFTVHILDCKLSRERDGIQQLVEVSGPEEELAGVMEEIHRSPDVKHVQMVKTKRGRILGTVVTKDSAICRTVMGLNLFCRSCFFSGTPSEEGSVEWTLALEDSYSLDALLNKLQEERVDARLLRLSRIGAKSTLTPRQERIIQLASERGYFDYPRKVTLSRLAQELSVEKSTLSEVLRRGQRKIVKEYLKLSRAKREASG